MSTKIVTHHVFCNFNKHDIPTASQSYCFPSSSSIKMVNFFNLSTKHGVTTKVMCSSGQDHHQEPGSPTPGKSYFPKWKKWTLLILLSIVLPWFGSKLGPLLLLKGKLNKAIETAEQVIEVVEDVAEATAEVAEVVQQNLSQDSELKEGVDVLKNISEKAVKEASEAKEFIRQIKNVEEEVLGSVVGSATDQADPINKGTDNKGVDQSVET